MCGMSEDVPDTNRKGRLEILCKRQVGQQCFTHEVKLAAKG